MLNIPKIQKDRPIEELIRFGIINLDKPTGPTSFSVSQFVKNLLNVNKTSHLGTLDPMVTGVLPIALGRACRLNDYLMHKDKTYVGIMRLHEEVPEKKLREVIKNFIGTITQMPPVRSRVKREFRQREVKSFDILEINGQDVLFETCVEAGTYIRKICDDMGKELGGAHMLELRRTRAAIFDESDSNFVNLYQLEEAVKKYKSGDEKELRKLIIPGEIVSTVLPVLEIKPEFVKKCLTGSPIFKHFAVNQIKVEKDDKICVISKDNFVGCYRAVSEGEVLAVPEFVFN